MDQSTQQFLIENPLIIPLLVLLTLWVLPWKAIALWKAAQLKSKIWFVTLLVVNTVGILEILYIFVFSKKKEIKSTNQHNIASQNNLGS